MTKEEIKATHNMTDVLNEYGIQVRRGRCLCPFHNDHDPSMKVHPDGVTCFTCGETWDIFGFVMKMEGIDFKTAFKKLGGKFERGKDSEYYRDAKKNLRTEPNAEGKNLLRALQICYMADQLHEWGSPEWQRLTSLKGYLEGLFDEGDYDWRVVEKLIAQYAGAKPKKSFERAEDEYRMELTTLNIKEVPRNGIST